MLKILWTPVLLSLFLFIPQSFSKDSTIQYKKNKFTVDKKSKNKKQNIRIKTGKTSDRRAYNGTIEQEIEAPIKEILTSVLDFENRCNNELKDRRKFHDEEMKCKYFNANLVESKIFRSKKLGPKKEQNIVDQFIVVRNIYNRYSFTHADLITISEETVDNKKKYRVQISMLSDLKTKKYLKEVDIKRTSAFLSTDGEFILEEISEKKTKLTYSYVSVTDHWLLNKSVSASTVMEKMENSFITLFSNIKMDANTRFVAKNAE